MIVETQKIIWNINILNGKECHLHQSPTLNFNLQVSGRSTLLHRGNYRLSGKHSINPSAGLSSGESLKIEQSL